MMMRSGKMRSADGVHGMPHAACTGLAKISDSEEEQGREEVGIRFCFPRDQIMQDTRQSEVGLTQAAVTVVTVRSRDSELAATAGDPKGGCHESGTPRPTRESEIWTRTGEETETDP